MNTIQNNFMEQHTTKRNNYLLSTSNFMDPYEKVQNNNQMSSTTIINEKKIDEVWSKHTFDIVNNKKVQVESITNFNTIETIWGATKNREETEYNNDDERNDNIDKGDEEINVHEPIKSDDNCSELDTNDNVSSIMEQTSQEQEETSPSHHARRPPNAFLIFCKKHRPIVRQRYPTTENRGITKILGEWWALLNGIEKQPYNDLAKEYKDAFLSANPDFRWYKLPAPPLRTLSTRPTTISKMPSALLLLNSPPRPATVPSEFTPGKLADESQLGGLTSLMNNNYNSITKHPFTDSPPCCKGETNNNNHNNNNNNNNNDSISVTSDDESLSTATTVNRYPENYTSPLNLIKTSIPPKPIKKRIYEQYEDDANDGSITQQELFNKVVDDIYATEKDERKEQRKSERMCKGKRYERFMVEGKLLGNKRDTKLTQHHKYGMNRMIMDPKLEHELNITTPTTSHQQHDLPKLNLESTIKRLAKRTNMKIDFDSNQDNNGKSMKNEQIEFNTILNSGKLSSSPPPPPPPLPAPPLQQQQPPSSPIINFNLDSRIDSLSSLNYDDFIKRKRESKKRKVKIKSDSSYGKMHRYENSQREIIIPAVVGSKKRKNKQSITHLNKILMENCSGGPVMKNSGSGGGKGGSSDGRAIGRPIEAENALLGLETLAMVAANTEKIGENNVI